MKIEYTDIVKVSNETLYVSIPKKLAKIGEIEKDDNLRIIIEKIGDDKR